MKEKCPNDKPGIEYRCHGGTLWEKTHGGYRENTGKPCPLCRGVKANEKSQEAKTAS